MEARKILRPDAKGRVCLGAIAKGISGYQAIINQATKEVLLKPYTELPYSEKWVYENIEVLESIKKGLTQSSKQQTVYKGSFEKFIEEDK
jgi:hypothetical protein